MTSDDTVRVVVVGRSPEKMKPATAILEAHGFVTIAAFSEEQAHAAIAAQVELFAVVAGGAIDQPGRERLRTAAASKGAVLIAANIGHDDPATHFTEHVLPKLVAAQEHADR
ncbi:MAG TPA: hypothetical protein VNT03_20315 [Baekduia sp.]|nr:hypothetical protein [Baekduia sp.]